MTPDQCTVVRDNLSGWMLADALCGDDDARRRLAQSVYFSSHTRDGRLSWFQCGPRGVAVGLEKRPVATWREIGAHLASLPADLERTVRAAYAEHRRLWSVYCHSSNDGWPTGTSDEVDALLRAAIDAARAASDEHLRDVLAPLLDRALTWEPPVVATQPDIFDLLAEVA